MECIKVLYDYLDTFLNFLYPRNIYCILCNVPIDRYEGYSICLDCKSKLKFIEEKACKKCGKPLDELYIIDKCPECVHSLYFYTRAISCIEYDDLSKKIIYDLKYHKKRYISYHIAEMICDRLIECNIYDFDVIMPVPLHKARERERTFNQAGIISKYIGKMTRTYVNNRNLIRVKNTITQNKLTREERRENLEGAFEVLDKDKVKGKNILLIDDVFTTGLTANQCSRVLSENGAVNVYIATLATGRNVY